MKDVLIIDSGGANLASLQFALERLGARAHVSRNALEIESAPRVILPGVGSARDAMRRLAAADLLACLPRLAQPVLGICLGMQLLFDTSEEGATQCLGVLPGKVQRLPGGPGLPVPHMGWNQLLAREPDGLLEGLGDAPYMYFVHSYAVPLGAHSRASTQYGGEFTAVVHQRNFWGTQFHPERSGAAGARLLANFLALN